MDSRLYIRLSVVITLLVFVMDSAWACPGCAGSLDKGGGYTKLAYILMAFIGLTYIPFSILYGMVIKNRNFNKPAESDKQ